MNTTPRLSALILLGLFLCGGLGAADWDWGISLDNYSNLVGTVGPASAIEEVVQKDKLGLWVQVGFSPAVTLSAEASYLFSYDTTATPVLLPYLFDLDYLVAEWTIRPGLNGSAGRFPVTDFSRLVLDHTLDGLQVRWDLPFMSLVGSVGTSAALLKPVSRIILSGPDGADLLDNSVYFAAPRLVQSVGAVFPQLFARQDLSVALLAQEDLRPSSQLIPVGYENPTFSGRAGGRLHSFLAGAGLSGPIASSLYYESFLYFETGTTLSYVADSSSGTGFSWQTKPIVAFLGGVAVHYYLERFLGSRVELRGLFASGDADNKAFLEGNTAGSSTLFVPISRQDTGLAFDPQLGNLLLLEASYSVKPAGSLQAILKAQAFLRPTAGAISETGLDPAATARYLGTQLEAVVNLRPWSDLGLAFSFGAFLPSAEAFLDADPRLAGRVELAASF
jgi:hypothetical protein